MDDDPITGVIDSESNSTDQEDLQDHVNHSDDKVLWISSNEMEDEIYWEELLELRNKEENELNTKMTCGD